MLTISNTLLLTIAFLFCAGQTAAQAKISPEEADKLAIEKPHAVYPANAKALRAKGIVRVEIVVSDQGVVTSAKPISGHPLLRASAAVTAKRYRYKPRVTDGSPVAFATTVDIPIPHDTPVGSRQEYEEQSELADSYFAEESKCRDSVKRQKWDEAEKLCLAAVHIAERLSSERELEKMGAHQMLGYALMGQNRPQEALDQFARARDAVRARLDETSAEAGRLYADMGITHHTLRDLDKAREMYRKAEKTYRAAIVTIEDENFAKQYNASLKKILEYHLIAAEQAGAAAEVEEIKSALRKIQ